MEKENHNRFWKDNSPTSDYTPTITTSYPI